MVIETSSMVAATTISGPYFSLIQQWLRQSRPHMKHNPVVYCMDQSAHEALASNELVDARLPRADQINAPNRRAYWVRRLSVLRGLFDAQGYVLHSDADALWLRDVTELMTMADIVFSSEHGLPKDIVERRGFVLCCGLFAVHKTPATERFFDLWEADCLRHSDDQIALNRLIDRCASPWVAFEHLGRTCFRASADFGAGPVSIVALGVELVCREHAFDAPPGAFVAHPFFERRFHGAFVAIYAYLLDRGAIETIDIPEPPTGWKRRDWAILCLYRQLGDAIPQKCLEHAAHLALRSGDLDLARSLLASTEPEGDSLYDLYQIQVALRETAAARETLARLLRSTTISDRMLLPILRATLADRQFGAAFKLAGSTAVHMMRPDRLYGAARRFYLRKLGAI